MNSKELKQEIGNIDIYLLDQILKERFNSTDKILDAGCGSGRNLQYFINNNFDVYGIDSNENRIKSLKNLNNNQNFKVAKLEAIPFNKDYFDYIICNAVLHFANNEIHFFKMFSELFRVLKTNGTLFIRMTSDFGIENSVNEIENGVYDIPDGSTRFLLTNTILEKLKNKYNFDFIEPLKTVNVNNLRCMSTLIIKKVF
ncbi:MAG TPA: class I SAM-dependent methyltransferase [Flavobacteriaceae bacterium]|nr:class I SAM-dependent methyltransferase [Flavobacteriaceae bacterium]